MGHAELTFTGSILIYRLYDVAWDIDLKKVEERVREFKRQSIDRKRFSKAFKFANPPLSLKLKSFEKTLCGKPYSINAYAKAYDYGVLSIIFEISVKEMEITEFEALARICDEPLREDFTQQLDRLVIDLGDALHQINQQKMEEDYTIYYLRQFDPAGSARDLLRTFDIGSLLLYEEGETPPSRATTKEMLSFSFSYSDNDLVVLSWDNAFVIEPGGSMDIPDLLEFANAQLLELRVYDDMVDQELDSISERIITEVPPSIWKIKRYEKLAARAMRTVMDLTGITEKIDNSLKVTEDVYYTRIYTSALSLFKVREWERSIERKITIASRVYDMLYREIANKRIELLEVIIIVLIAVEILLFLMMKI